MKHILVILLSVGLIFLRSGYEKFSGGIFVNSLEAILAKTAEKSPYSLFRDFLTTVVIPNSHIFGSLVMWGELLSGIAITFGSVMLLFRPQVNRLVKWVLISGLAGGLFLNINFWLGFGYTSPSADSLNLLMIIIEVVGLRVFTKSKTS